jgi:hypothetical protein
VNVSARDELAQVIHFEIRQPKGAGGAGLPALCFALASNKARDAPVLGDLRVPVASNAGLFLLLQGSVLPIHSVIYDVPATAELTARAFTPSKALGGRHCLTKSTCQSYMALS